MTLAHPWFLLLLLLLPLVAWLRRRRGKPAAFLYSSLELTRLGTRNKPPLSGLVLRALRWAGLVLFIVAMARPQDVHTETSIKASGIDIAVALDLSGSMESEDFRFNRQTVNRLFMAKEVLKNFVRKRPGDRIGLIAFAGRAYVASPLTLDHEFLVQNIERLELHMIEDGTAIGSGLSTAVNRLRDLKSKSKIVILMTDGQNNAGKVQPLTAAEAAAALGIKVYTIGVGIRGMAPMPRRDQFGRKYAPVMVEVDIDENTLTKIADMTGGHYYRADSAETLQKIYEEIDRLEKSEVDVKKFVNVEERMAWFLLPALGLLALELLLGQTIWRRLP